MNASARDSRGEKQKENNGSETDGRRDEVGKSGWCADNSSITGLFTRIMYSRGSWRRTESSLSLVLPCTFSVSFSRIPAICAACLSRVLKEGTEGMEPCENALLFHFDHSGFNGSSRAFGWWRTYESSTSKSHYLRKFKLPSFALFLSSRFSLWRGERTRWNDSKTNFSGLLSLFSFSLSFFFILPFLPTCAGLPL